MFENRDRTLSESIVAPARLKSDARAIQSLGRLGSVEVLVDRRRRLPYVTRAKGEHFEVVFMADNAHLAWDIAYDLAGWYGREGASIRELNGNHRISEPVVVA